MSDRPNIVLVTVDSLRADHCGFMGYEKDTTPTLDEMAEEGVVFENAIAPAPFTEQSVPPMFTGSYPLRLQGDDALMGEFTRAHITKHGSIAQDLSNKGYATAGFSPNPHASRQFGLDQGFDTFHDFIGDDASSETLKTMLSRIAKGDFVEALRVGANMFGLSIPGFGNQSIPMRAYYDQMVNWASNTTEPFFIWAFPLEVHSPYRPERQFRDTWFHKMLYLNLVRSSIVNRDPSPEEAEMLRSLYDGTIRSIDASLSQLHSDLADADPIIIVTSDHGEAFGEHRNFGHKDDLYDENVHVPLLIAGTDESKRISDPVSLKNLPAMVSRIAEGGSVDWQIFTEQVVSSRVHQHAISTRTRDSTYLVSGTSSRTFSQEDDSNEETTGNPLPDQRLLEKARRVATHRKERRIVADSVDDSLGVGIDL